MTNGVFREIGRLLRPHKRKAEADWRNNPPIVTPHNEEDKLKAFLMQKLVDQWWKENHKKVWNKSKTIPLTPNKQD